MWTATLTATELAVWLEPPRDDSRYTILERQTAIDFPAPDEAIDTGVWEQGRIFGEPFELRWERTDDRFRVWLAGALAEPFVDERRHLPGAKKLHLSAKTTGEISSCFLWGHNEVRVARAPGYRALPENTGRFQLLVRNFRGTDGSLVFSRYTGMAVENTR
ncbi:MAG: hypothetical protein ACRD82_24035 [Blastocatellia bacterium]